MQRFEQEFIPVPHEPERADDVAHAEDVDARDASHKHDGQRHPKHVLKYSLLADVQIRSVSKQQYTKHEQLNKNNTEMITVVSHTQLLVDIEPV